MHEAVGLTGATPLCAADARGCRGCYERDSKGPGLEGEVDARAARHAGRSRRVIGLRALHPDRLEGQTKKGGVIRPDQFEEFPISVRIPDGNPGDQLVFPAFQSYRSGERVAWTGGPDAEQPAPRLTLTAPMEE
jgi:hypothetical protein